MSELSEAEQIDVIMRSVARGTDTPERGAAAVKRILAAHVEPYRAAYEAKVQEFAVETWVTSKAHEWAVTKDGAREGFAATGDLADVGVDRGRLLAKKELLAVLLEARKNAPALALAPTPPSGEES